MASTVEAYVQLLGHVREPILLVSRTGTIVAGNLAAAEALGTSTEGFAGAELDGFAREPLGDRLRHASQGEASFQLQARDGRRFACDASSLTEELVVVRLSGGPEASQRAGAFFEMFARVERIAPPGAAIDELARTLLTVGMSSVRALAGGLFLLDETGETLELVGSVGYPAIYMDRFRLVPVAFPMPLTDSVRRPSAIYLLTKEAYVTHYADFIRTHPQIALRGIACIPLVLEGRCIGTIGLGFPIPYELTDDERAFLQTFALQCAEAMVRTRAQTRVEPSDDQQRLERLHAFTGALARAITPADVAEAAVDAGMAATGARSGGLWLRNEDGITVDLVRAVGPTGPLPEKHMRVPLDRPSRMPILDAVRDGMPVWIESCAQLEERYPDAFRAFSRGGESSLACVPLLAQGRCIGGLSYNHDGARRFVEDDRAFYQVLAWYVAQTLDRVRLHASERFARREAEASYQRSAFLADLDSILVSLDYQSKLAAIAAAAVPRIADWCIVELEEERRLGRPAVGAHVDPEKLPFVLALADSFRERAIPGHGVPEVIRTGTSRLYPVFTAEQIRAAPLDRELVELTVQAGAVSAMVVPISARGQTLGAILLTSADPKRTYDQHDLAMAEELGRKVGLAIENARLYRDVREADRLKDEFLAMLSHELRNPLVPIVTTLELMQLRDANTLPRERELIRRNIDHLVRLIDDLLDVSRITRSKIELTTGRVDLVDVIADAVEIAHSLIVERGHRLSVEAPRGIDVMIDRVRMTQTISNLLTNAARYTDRGGTIAVTAGREVDGVVIRVRDSGIGITPDMLPRVFDLFVQAGRSSDRTQGGLGIGLTVVKGLVELHGGMVTAHSAGLGHGSEFVIRLPVLADDHVVAPAPVDLLELRHRRVLVVDDNHDAARLTAELLEEIGCTTLVAHDGAAALQAFQAFDPDLALLDLGLPEMDGYELARRLRSLCPSLRIVAVTGYGQDTDRTRSREAGFDQHLVKPVDLAGLRRLLDET